MFWTGWLWTAVIPSVPLVVPGVNVALACVGLLLVVSAVALALERDRAAMIEHPANLPEGALGCAA
ncbi:MAG: hypothetical protein KatS3mg077_3268 [Candidatus Binatia bacterium]|nr:MAG: hypothetical protein KatS3mg077_3268 [Candidatus Binatia bacterium]